MKNTRNVLRRVAAVALFSAVGMMGTNGIATANDKVGTGNPYLPFWEHIPDGEPRVFEDQNQPLFLFIYN